MAVAESVSVNVALQATCLRFLLGTFTHRSICIEGGSVNFALKKLVMSMVNIF